MTACAQPGCTGTVAADGYCDTCGMAAASSPVAVPPVAASAGLGAPVPPRGTVGVGGACTQPGCTGTVAADGYCDTCGMADENPTAVRSAPTSTSAPDRHGADSASSAPATFAQPVAPSTSARIPGAGTATARSRQTTSRTARTGRTGSIGAGLVTVPPTEVGDPAAAVMTEDQVESVLGAVPEDKRVCSVCGAPVGRSDGTTPGRVKGFCGQCRAPYDFITNRPALTAGELVGGQYEIVGPLAHGGMGWVYLGRDRAVSDRWVVLKGLLNQDDPDAVLSAVAERRFLAEIDHPSIVNIYNFVAHRGAGYIVMEMVGGESLNTKLKNRRAANGGTPDPLPVTDAIAYILGVLPAFGYLHERGLVYNDLKPANIMAVGDDVELIDVGAVMRIDDESAAIFGTQGFQAPEVAAVGPSIASDLYTVGRTLAVLIVAFVFHDGPYQYALPTPASEPMFARWESLYRFLLRATATHPDDRFQSAEEMRHQLVGVLREIVAINQGRPLPTASMVFEGDRLPQLLVNDGYQFDAAEATWRALPPTRVDTDHPQAAFLLSLADNDPDRAVAALQTALNDGSIDVDNEVLLQLVWAMLNTDNPQPAAIDRVLDQAQQSDPWDWRVSWYRGLLRLRYDQPAQAAKLFSDVWTEVPGETAPKLAVALAAEYAGETDRAHQLYDLVTRTDNSFVSAAFGLARCNRSLDRTEAVIEALNRVPTTSAAHYDAQVTSARILVAGGKTGTPSEDDLALAAATVERLQLDAGERAALSADIFRRALEGITSGRIKADGRSLLSQPLEEDAIRQGLEATYRLQARLAMDTDERERLVDEANAVRPWSLF